MTEFPKYLFIDDSSIRISTTDNITRSEMDNGLAKTKRLNSVPILNFSFNITVNRRDLGSFYKWFLEDLGGGQRWFLLRNLSFGEIQRFRFVTTQIEWEKLGTLYVTNVTIEGHVNV